MVNDTNVFSKSAKVSGRQNEIEMIGTITLLNHSKLTVDIRCFTLHMFELLIA